MKIFAVPDTETQASLRRQFPEFQAVLEHEPHSMGRFGISVFDHWLRDETEWNLMDWRRKRMIERAFQGRASLTPEKFYETYFLKKGFSLSVVAGVRDVLETQLSADLSRLVDTDDFSKNLSFFWSFDSMADVEVVCALEKRFQIEISDDEALNAHTVEDIVSLVHKKTGVQGQP